MKKQIITLGVCLLAYAGANAQDDKKEKQSTPSAVNEEKAKPVEAIPATNGVAPAQQTEAKPSTKEEKHVSEENKAVKMEKAKKEEEVKKTEEKKEVK